MKRAGFTLVELLVVITIMGILMGIGTLGFNSMSRKYAVDNQTRALYSDLMEIRLKALYKKKSHYVTLASGSFTAYSSGDRSTPVGVVMTRLLAKPIQWNGTGALIEFNSHGLTNDLRSICVTQNETAPALDSIVVATARVNLGKRQAGKDCDAAFIDIK